MKSDEMLFVFYEKQNTTKKAIEKQKELIESEQQSFDDDGPRILILDIETTGLVPTGSSIVYALIQKDEFFNK